MTTLREQDIQFIDDMIDHNLLEKAMEWIANNIKPDEVYSEDQLREWALSNGMEDKP